MGQYSANSHFQAGTERLEKGFSTRISFLFAAVGGCVGHPSVKPPPAVPCEGVRPVLALPMDSPWSCPHPYGNPPGNVPLPAASRGDMWAHGHGYSLAETSPPRRGVEGEEEPFVARLARAQEEQAATSPACQ